MPNDDVFVLIGGEPLYPFLRRIGIRFGGDPATDPEQATVTAGG